MNFILINGVYLNGAWMTGNQPAPQVSSVYTAQSSENCMFVSGSARTEGRSCNTQTSFFCEFVNAPESGTVGKLSVCNEINELNV
jgi:hypothetical protein